MITNKDVMKRVLYPNLILNQMKVNLAVIHIQDPLIIVQMMMNILDHQIIVLIVIMNLTILVLKTTVDMMTLNTLDHQNTQVIVMIQIILMNMNILVIVMNILDQIVNLMTHLIHQNLKNRKCKKNMEEEEGLEEEKEKEWIVNTIKIMDLILHKMNSQELFSRP